MASKKTIKAVSIVGFAPTCVETPFERSDMHFWGMNDLWNTLTKNNKGAAARWHAWFDLHDTHVQQNNPRTGPQHWNWLKSVDWMPVYFLEANPDIPASVTFPMEECAALSWNGKPYFTSTPAYMVALAILQGYQEIHCYGINLLGNEEYAYQRPCFEYWCGIAQGRGINIVIPEGATVLKSNFKYGYDTHGSELDPFHKHIKHKLVEHLQRLEAAKTAVTTLNGAVEGMKYFDQMYDHYKRGGTMPDENRPLPIMAKLPQATEHLKGWHEKTEKEEKEAAN